MEQQPRMPKDRASDCGNSEAELANFGKNMVPSAGLEPATEYVDHLDRYMRLALKAQGQCRATLETLATIKNPPVVFARQANIAQGPQQVNNVVSVSRDAQPTRAAKRTTRTNRTIDVDGS